ncbi:TIGR03960 family B12-binding radical SAM protein [Desulfovibrio inopinatus]|uniref:TIGR03960 family B12-binding radical SAM protein n=1 Tax=Desulfovibrio inopinatus TaxID=102109 RepID=UPI0003FB9BC4|nr:TIGR03960 family B12-binding radical SAM protein [Desulfovibrio inopinatus]
MKDILYRLPRPSHYIGSEWGAVVKDPEAVDVHMAFAFPDLYEVGMSYVGQKILYEVVNAEMSRYAERVFAPTREAAEVMQAERVPLSSLETGTPLAQLDAIAFHLTHELCYTNVLFMLDLAGIPLRSQDRNETHPLILAGGGCTFNAEPMAPFFDIMVLGDGERVILEILDAIAAAKQAEESRAELLTRLQTIQGVYVPSCFDADDTTGAVTSHCPGYDVVHKAIVEDLNAVTQPTHQVLPFGKAVHDRLSLEIARGCTRGCRFCQAGMLYRPVRERSLESLAQALRDGLDDSGYEELAFLSLSTGDYSALDSLFRQSASACLAEQISISLPSLRAGTLTEEMRSLMSRLRRTGATVAPEAGSQRLRDVVNKGITEEDILKHAEGLFASGWQNLKLYFMIGLPTETEDDVRAIFDLAMKVLATAGPRAKRLNITVAVSPFVPKPHTPFQWEAQLSRDEVHARVSFLRNLFFRHRKRFTVRWHDPKMTWLEGIFARGDRHLADAVETAYRKDALFCSWIDQLDLAPWEEAFAEHGIDADAYLGARDEGAPLPWDHLHSGVEKDFLLRERRRALEEKSTPDCRYGACSACGVCDMGDRRSPLSANMPEETRITPHLVSKTPWWETESGETVDYPNIRDELGKKVVHLKLRYEKTGPAVALSQLELQTVFDRALRRAKLKPAFSKGFNPQPLFHFGWALPVGVASLDEWFGLFFRVPTDPETLPDILNAKLPQGIRIIDATPLTMARKIPMPTAERFTLRFVDTKTTKSFLPLWKEFQDDSERIVEVTSKRGAKQVDIRPYFASLDIQDESLAFEIDWRHGYMSPLKLVGAVCDGVHASKLLLTKIEQCFEDAG